MFIYQVAQSLGLSVDLKPISKGQDNNYYIIPCFKSHRVCNQCDEDANEREKLTNAFSGNTFRIWNMASENWKPLYGQVETTEGIKWCLWSEEKGDPFLSCLTYGNEPCIELYYQSAALLVKVPRFTMTRGGMASSTTPHAEEENDLPAKKMKIENPLAT